MHEMTDDERANWGELINLLADYIRAVITRDFGGADRFRAALAIRGINIQTASQLATDSDEVAK